MQPLPLVRKLLFPLLAALATSASMAHARAVRNIPYAGTANERQMLDVYAPERNGENRPVVVWVHGGGWQRGDKSELAQGSPGQNELKPQAFVERGCVFIAMNYRFIPVVTLQEMAGDVAKAIRWAHQHAREYGGDPDSLFVMGHSAGAQLSALVCTDERYLKAEGLSFKVIKGCVPVDGGTFYPLLQIETHLAQEASFRLKFPVGGERELASVLYVAKGKGIPPFLILHIADNPASGTALQSVILGKVLQDAEVPAKVIAVPGKTHATLNADLGLPGDLATQALFEFVAEQTRRSRKFP
ncbi:MAG: alpha/beta hydrolase [Verrucomicrobia bacterium]|nr:alpha/beta hydrolase [Verrucomicrobiota bacterium]